MKHFVVSSFSVRLRRCRAVLSESFFSLTRFFSFAKREITNRNRHEQSQRAAAFRNPPPPRPST
jgi:hypothetical protein